MKHASSWRLLSALALPVLLPGCSVAIDLPPLLEEESLDACRNAEDDDLDGEMNCADPGCAAFCPNGLNHLLPTFTCFTDPSRGLAFREVGVDPTRCDPKPDRDVICAGDEHLIPGAVGCRRVGGACPDGWAIPEGEHPRVWYVRPGEDGVGTEADPFGTLASAIDVSGAGDAIVLAAGDHVATRVDVDVLGACVAQTRIVGQLEIAADVRIANLSAERLVVEGTLDAVGVAVDGETVVVGSATFDGSRLEAGTGELALQVDGRATIVGSTIRASERAVSSAGELSLRGVAVRDTTVFAVEALGPTTTLEGVSIEIASGVGVDARCTAEETSECLTLVRSSITSLDPSATSLGLALEGPSGVRETVVSGMAEGALRASATVDLSDLVLENGLGFGASFEGEATALLTRALIRNHGARALNVVRGATVTAVDLSVRAPATSTTDSCIVNAGELFMMSFSATSCVPCGLMLEAESATTLSDGLLQNNGRAVCLARRLDVPLQALTTSVTYRDNRSNITLLDR